MLSDSDIARDEAVIQAATAGDVSTGGPFFPDSNPTQWIWSNVREPGMQSGKCIAKDVRPEDAVRIVEGWNRWPAYIQAAREANELRERVKYLESLCRRCVNVGTFNFIGDELFDRLVAAAGDAAKGDGDAKSTRTN